MKLELDLFHIIEYSCACFWGTIVNKTLSNGFKLLEMLSEDGGAYSVKELSSMAGLPSSNICRLLKTLVQTGYLEQNPKDRKYRVSLKLLQLSHARLKKLDLRRLGHPFAARLAEELKASVFLSAPCKSRSIVVDVVWPQEVVGDPVLVVGQVHSVSHSACGKICAAFAPPEEMQLVEAAVAAENPEDPPEKWMREFARIRKDRFAVRRENEILAVGAPLFRAKGIFAGAIGVFFPGGSEPSTELEHAVRRTANAISFSLGHPYSD